MNWAKEIEVYLGNWWSWVGFHGPFLSPYFLLFSIHSNWICEEKKLVGRWKQFSRFVHSYGRKNSRNTLLLVSWNIFQQFHDRFVFFLMWCWLLCEYGETTYNGHHVRLSCCSTKIHIILRVGKKEGSWLVVCSFVSCVYLMDPWSIKIVCFLLWHFLVSGFNSQVYFGHGSCLLVLLLLLCCWLMCGKGCSIYFLELSIRHEISYKYTIRLLTLFFFRFANPFVIWYLAHHRNTMWNEVKVWYILDTDWFFFIYVALSIFSVETVRSVVGILVRRT